MVGRCPGAIDGRASPRDVSRRAFTPPPSDFSSPRPRAPIDLDALLSDPLDAIGPLPRRRPEERRELARLASRLRARAEEAAPALDWGVCHGDLGAANVHVAARGA